MRILHVADRLPGRGGAYTWMLGILEGLAPHHDQALVVGELAGRRERWGCRRACAWWCVRGSSRERRRRSSSTTWSGSSVRTWCTSTT